MGSYYDDYFDDDFDHEEEERRRYEGEKVRLQGMSPEALGKEWERHCHRHDLAVDRCEEINSPTIEDAAGWMRFIEKEFESRSLRFWDFTLKDE